MTRAVEDQLALIPEERTSELGGIICNCVRRPHGDPTWVPSQKGTASKLGRIIEKDEGRAMETTPVAALDTGKGQGNRSLDARVGSQAKSS